MSSCLHAMPSTLSYKLVLYIIHMTDHGYEHEMNTCITRALQKCLPEVRTYFITLYMYKSAETNVPVCAYNMLCMCC